MNDEMSLNELLLDTIHQKNVLRLRMLFDEYNIVDLAELVNELEVFDIIFIFKTVPKEITGQLFSYLDSETVEKLLNVFNSNEIKSLMDYLYSDDLIDFLQELPAPLSKKVLSSASSQQKKIINELLSYQDGTAGSIMSVNYFELDEDDTILVAVDKIKHHGKKAETLNTCFVLNKEGRLIGTVTLRDILFEQQYLYIKDIMDIDFNFVLTSEDTEEVAKIMQKYDDSVIAVTDDQEHLLGIITIDDVFDIIQEEATEDIHKMAAITPLEYPYMEVGSFKIAKSRLIWLMLLMVSYALSSIIITNNSDLLVVVPSLITFIPMLMDTSGNAGSQASAMVIRGITVDNLSVKDFFRVLFKELFVALIVGAILFAVNLIRILLFVPNVGLDVAFIVCISLYLVVMIAKLTGGLFPLLALVFKLDPAVMASPLITTTCDALSLLTYFSLAALWLHG